MVHFPANHVWLQEGIIHLTATYHDFASEISEAKKTKIWLVVTGTWLDYFSIHYWECHHPNWRSHFFFQRDRYTTNQKWWTVRFEVSLIFRQAATRSDDCGWTRGHGEAIVRVTIQSGEQRRTPLDQKGKTYDVSIPSVDPTQCKRCLKRWCFIPNLNWRFSTWVFVHQFCRTTVLRNWCLKLGLSHPGGSADSCANVLATGVEALRDGRLKELHGMLWSIPCVEDELLANWRWLHGEKVWTLGTNRYNYNCIYFIIIYLNMIPEGWWWRISR